MLTIGILSQIVTFIFTNDTLLALISGIAGIYSVVYCSEKKMKYYLFSIIQILTYAYICWQNQLYGKLIENGVYIISTIIGVYIWFRHLDNDKKVITKKLNKIQWIITITCTIIGMIITYYLLNFVNGNNVMLDTLSTVLALTAQILMIMRYKENWIVWFIVDVLCIWIWIVNENWCMTIQYTFWLINTIYGYILWKKQ
jgi:nicotinamide mononucleotide transporter